MALLLRELTPISIGLGEPTDSTGIYSLLFCICLWVIYRKRNLNIFLSSAALVSYTLSVTYVVLDLIRVANSYTVDPKRPWVMTYVSDHINTVNYVASSTYIANVRRSCNRISRLVYYFVFYLSCRPREFQDDFLGHSYGLSF